MSLVEQRIERGESGQQLHVEAALPAAIHLRWRRRLAATTIATDASSSLLGSLVAVLAIGIKTSSLVHGLVAGAIYTIAALGLWLGLLALGRAYDPHHLTVGYEEPRRVMAAGGRAIMLYAFASFFLNLDVGRGFVVLALGVSISGSLTGRWIIRRVVHHVRNTSGRLTSKTLLVGEIDSVDRFAEHVRGAKWAGIQAVGACCPPPGDRTEVAGLPRVGQPDSVMAAIQECGADTVVLTSDPETVGIDLRTLAWDIEGTGIQLVVAPALADFAGPRIVSRPVAGLPVLYIDEPKLDGPHHTLKSVMDRVVAAGLILALLPVFVLTAAAVKLTSRGPVFYRQKRIGRYGNSFGFIKFRSMVQNADKLRTELIDLNEADGPMFKIRRDPRITRVGKFIRRYSIDELPQLWHVITGDMSLVGPRPPLPTEVVHYDGSAKRRLLVKPGITGLWQVSGRSDLSWDESLRLDLEYVEGWSPMLDLAILAKTGRAVLSGRGAY